MNDNQELTLVIASIDATLKDIAGMGSALLDSLQFIDDELAKIAAAQAPAPRAPSTGYPWAPGTQAQGFLTGRWNRRDGNVYSAQVVGAEPPHSPYVGGENSQSEIRARSQQRQRNGPANRRAAYPSTSAG